MPENAGICKVVNLSRHGASSRKSHLSGTCSKPCRDCAHHLRQLAEFCLIFLYVTWPLDLRTFFCSSRSLHARQQHSRNSCEQPSEENPETLKRTGNPWEVSPSGTFLAAQRSEENLLSREQTMTLVEICSMNLTISCSLNSSNGIS